MVNMLTSATKFKHITDHFIEPYFIQTDSSGKVMAICEKFSSLLPNYNITNNNYHNNLFDLFLDMTDRIPEFSTDIEKNGLPKVFDLPVNSTIKKDLTIRWITSPVAFDDGQPRLKTQFNYKKKKRCLIQSSTACREFFIFLITQENFCDGIKGLKSFRDTVSTR